MNFSSHGIEVEFDDNSKEVLRALENAVQRGLEAIGETAERYAKEEITRQGAVDTGALRNSINYQVRGDDCYIGTRLKYGRDVELGTGKYAEGGGGTSKPSWVYQDAFGNWHRAYPQKPRPFLKPAAANHGKEYREILKKSLENA